MLEEAAQIISHERQGGLYFRLVLRAPRIAPQVQPGQFVHVRILPLKEALLRRPFSVFQADADTLSILYKAVGRGTEVLSQMRPGEELSLIGPLGHGFSVPPPGGEAPLLVAGGYGMAALYLLAQRSPQKGIAFVGGRTAGDILCEDDFRALGWDVRVATEDGTRGDKGLVTQPLLAELERRAPTRRNWLGNAGSETGAPEATAARALPAGAPVSDPARKLFACGPTPMLKAVGQLADRFGLPAELSLDEKMCCGVGVCLTCVVPIKAGDGWEYQRSCTEGPVFDSRQIVWEAAP